MAFSLRGLKWTFLNSIFDLKSKSELRKILWFFNFGNEIEKRKTKNFKNSFCF